MAYSPTNNPYVPGDPYMYDLKWLVERIKSNETSIESAIQLVKDAEIGAQTAATVADMTNHDKIYIYVGNESGYTNGNWYYWNGSAWVSGGTYGGAIVDSALSSTSVNPVQNRVINSALNGKQAALTFPLTLAQGGTNQTRTYSDTSNAGMYLYKWGEVVTITLRGIAIQSVSDGVGSIGTLPADYRPNSYLYIPVNYYDGNDQYSGQLLINSDGTTAVKYLASGRWQTPTTNGRIQGMATYLVMP